MELLAGTPVNLTSSGAVSLSPGTLIGFYVASVGSSPTLILRDGGSSGTAISGTITPVAGYSHYPAQCTTGCYATIGGTVNVTIFYQ